MALKGLLFVLALSVCFALAFQGGSNGYESNGQLGEPTNCSSAPNCSICIQSFACVWCDSEAGCVAGSWNGPEKVNDTDIPNCDAWRWKQCELAGKYSLLSLLLFLIVILLCCLCFWLCVCVKCNRRKPRVKATAVSSGHIQSDLEAAKEIEAEKQKLLGSHPTTSKKKELLRRYGISEVAN